MASSAEQHGRLLLLLLPFVSTMAITLSPLQDGQAVSHNVLTSLVSGPLRGHDLLLVSDDHSQSLLDVGQVVAAAGSSTTPIFLASQNSVLHTRRPDHHTKGTLLTTLLLFHDDPTNFLLLLESNVKWNPNYLVLFCLNALLDTTTVIGLPVVQRSEFILLLQPEPKKGSQRLTAYTSFPTMIKAPLGTWSLEKFSSRQSLFPFRYQDFGGEVLDAPGVCADEPILYEGDDGNCAGLSPDMMNIIGAKHNFSHKVYRQDSVVWSYKENGTWIGMLGEILYEDKEIVINSMKLNPEECRDFDYTYPYLRHNFGIMIRVPPPIPRWRNILYPFSRVTWALVLGTTVIVATLLALLVHYVHNLSDPMDIALKVVSGLFGQAMNDRRLRMFSWARIWLICWWVSVDILAAAYMSNLMSVLTIPSYPARIQTLEQLADSDLIPCMLAYGIFVPFAMRASKNPVYKTLGDRMFLDPYIDLSDPYEILLRSVMNGTFALVESIDYLQFTHHRKGLTYTAYIMDEKLYKYYMSWFLPPNTPYTSLFSMYLQRFVETGLLSKIYQTHLASITIRASQGRGSGVLALDHLQGAFIAWGLGLLLAAVVMGAELLVHKCPSSSSSSSSRVQSLHFS